MSTSQSVVITNTGRLPITTVELLDASAAERGTQGTSYWSRITEPGKLEKNIPVSLYVGEAIAARVALPGRTQSSLGVVTSDGKRRPLKKGAATETVDSAPESVTMIFENMPGCVA